MAAEQNEDLIFPMKLDVDIQQWQKDWGRIQKEVQKTITATPFKIKLDVNTAEITKAVRELQKLDMSGLKGNTIKDKAAAMRAEAQLINAKLRGKTATIDLEAKEAALANARARGRKMAIDSEAAELRLNRAKEKGVAAVHTQNKAYQAQKGFLNGLPQMMNSYISVLGGYRFVSNIREITGEFELQRVALGALIQDADRANMLFEQIKTKAVESPFMVKDMVTYTKQLAAFRVETEDLFGTMNMLADISAGLGVGMDRLILAYGQVKAASVLRGQELRQFTEAGIPLVDLLAKKFEQLNGVAMSTGDVFKLISKRGVSFEMVDQIFKDMTESGGTFFNMQQIQAKTLSGIWNNLTDAYQIMMDEMGRENRGVLAGTGKVLRELALNWRTILSIMSPLTAAFMAYKVVTVASSIATRAANKEEAVLLAIKTKQTIQVKLLNRAIALETVGRLAEANATLAASMANNFFTRTLYLMKAAMLANPITFWVTLLTTATATIVALVSAISSFENKEERLTNRISESNSNIKSSADLAIYSLEGLYSKLTNTTKGSQEYSDVIAEINKRTQPYIEGNLDAAASHDEVRKAIEATTVAIKAQAKAKAQEAASQIIESDYVAASTKAYEKMRKVMTSKGRFSEAQAQSIVQNMMDSIAENPDLGKSQQKLQLVFYKALSEAQKSMGNLDKSGAWGMAINASSAIRDLLSAQDDQTKATDRSNAALDAMYNTTTRQKKVIDDLNKSYSDQAKVIRNTPYAKDAQQNATITTTKLFDLETRQINALISAYKNLGDASNVAKQRRLLEKHLTKGADWESTVDKMTKGSGTMVPFGTLGEGSSTFARTAGEDPEDYLSYMDRLQDSYTKILETEKKLSDQKWAKIPASDKAAILKSKQDAEAIAKALGWNLEGLKSTKVGGIKTTDPRIAALTEELRLIEEAYKKYQELSKFVGSEAAKATVTSEYGSKVKTIPLAFSAEGVSDSLSLAIQGYSNLGKDAADEMAKTFLKRNDLNFDNIVENFKTNMDKLGSEIEQMQRANDFYEKMLGLTGSEDAAKRLTEAMGLTVGNVRKSMNEALAKSMVTPKIGDTGGKDFSQGVDLSNINAVQEAINAMPAETQKNAQKMLDSIVSYEQNALQSILGNLDEYQSYEDKKLRIIADYNKKLADIESSKLSPEQKLVAKTQAGRTKDGSIANLDFETLKGLDAYIMAFEDLDRVGSATLVSLRTELQKMSDSGRLLPADLKAVSDQIQKIDALTEKRNPFTSLADGAKKYRQALLDVQLYGVDKDSSEFKKTQNDLISASDQMVDAGKNIETAFSTAVAPLNNLVDSASALADAMGMSFSDETNAYIDEFKKGITVVTSAISMMNSVLAITEVLGMAALGPLAILAAAIGVVSVLNKWSDDQAIKKQTKEIEKQSKALDRLAEARLRLERESSKVVGSDYTKNVKDRVKLLNDEAAAYKKQVDAEKSKKKFNGYTMVSATDKEKLKEYEDAYAETLRNIEDLNAEFLSNMAGTELASAAKDFASAWLDAYYSFGDTAAAIQEKFKDMMNNLITNAVLSKIVLGKLTPVFDQIELMFSANSDGNENATAEELARLEGLMATILPGLDNVLKASMGALEKAGITTRQGQTSLTGIAKSIGTMSEDSANTMTGYLNSNLYQLVLQTDLLRKIATGEKADGGLQELYALQGLALSELRAINSNTKRNADAADNLVDKFDKLMRGGNTHFINTRLIN